MNKLLIFTSNPVLTLVNEPKLMVPWLGHCVSAIPQQPIEPLQVGPFVAGPRLRRPRIVVADAWAGCPGGTTKGRRSGCGGVWWLAV